MEASEEKIIVAVTGAGIGEMLTTDLVVVEMCGEDDDRIGRKFTFENHQTSGRLNPCMVRKISG